MADIIQTLQLKDDPTTKVFPNIKEGSIPSGAVTSDKIAASAVTTAKVADSAITSAKIASNSVSTSKIQDSAVNTNKVAEGAITEGKIVNGAVTRTKLGNNAVNIAKLNIYTDKWLSYLRSPSSINDFLQSVFLDYLHEVVTNTLIELQMYSYNGNVYSPVKIYYDLTSSEVYLYVLDDTGWNNLTIDSSTPWATAYNWLKDIYITYLL